MTTAALPQTPLIPFELPLPPKEESSLASKAMLCSVSISAWSGYKYDREASEEIADIHGAEKDSGRFNKRLVPRKELEEITKVIGLARRDHEFVTLPWSDNGYRVLPAAAYMDHTETMRKHAAEFRAAVSRLEARFEVLITSQSRLGTLFKISDYPGMRDENGKLSFAFPNELRERFSFETKVLPLPDADDFRVAMGDEDRERIKRQIADSIQASLRVGTRELWQRLYKVVSHMSQRMTEYNSAKEGEKPRLYDSMITNIVEIVDVLPKLNIAGDTELDRMASEVRRSLVVDPKELRKSEGCALGNRQSGRGHRPADGRLHGRTERGCRVKGSGGPMKNENSLERKLTRARTQLLLSQPFFGTLCLRLKLVEGSVPTMATDGRRILFNPEFVRSLQAEELQAVLAHEVLHCALGHHCRRGQRDPQLWNEAADLAINPLLVANGFSLPAGALIDPEFDDLSTEEIYARRLQPKQSGDNSSPQESDASCGSGGSQQNQGQGPSPESAQKQPQDQTATGTEAGASRTESPRPAGFGEVMDATDEDGRPASEAERSRQQHEWSIAADQAIRSAKACGHEPNNIDRPLAESRQSKQDWRSVLRDFVAARMLSDYRWNPPNRRFVACGLYLPSVARTGLGTIVIGVDTSGSVGEKELEQFAGEISSICDEAQPESVHVVYCDAAVQGVQEFGPSEPVHLKPKGGGGTDFRPVFQWVEENGIDPACLIYLTDLFCHSYPNPPEYPVLWVTDSHRRAPFGETVEISLD